MQISALFQKFGRDLGYLCVIGGLLGWIWVDGKRQKVWNEILSATTEQSIDNTSKNNDVLLVQINKITDAYPSEGNDKLRTRAMSAKKLVASLKDKIAKAQIELPLRNKKTTETLEELRISVWQLCDSLSSFTADDSISNLKIKSLLGQNDAIQFWETIKNLNPGSTKIALNTLTQKTELAFSELLNYFSLRVGGLDLRFDSYELMSSPDSAAIQIGGTYQANIFLSSYSSVANHVNIKVNGKQLPITLGLAHFSQRYTSPGQKKYEVEIELKNPLTGTVSSYKKEFGLIVVDSCQ